MNRSNATLALYLSLVFVSGAAVGALGHRYFVQQPQVSAERKARPTPEEFRRMYMAEMRGRLKLSDDQAAKLEVILDDTRTRYREMREKHRPEMKAIQDEQVLRINAILSADQQTEYTKMREERERRKKEEEARKVHER